MDPLGLGADGGMVVAVGEMTNWVKELARDWGFEDYLRRFYTVVPILCGFFLCMLIEQNFWASVTHGLKYGLLSIFMWNVYKKSVRGE